jgi:hypothetical protein
MKPSPRPDWLRARVTPPKECQGEEVIIIDHQVGCALKHYFDMKREVNPQKALTVRCPTCGAKPGEKCELTTGQPRAEPHRDRRLLAKDES